jgi:hypothetical protein
MSGPAVASPAVNRLDIVAVGTDAALWHKAWTGSSWSDWSSAGGQWTWSPAAVALPGLHQVQLFTVGPGSGLWHTKI